MGRKVPEVRCREGAAVLGDTRYLRLLLSRQVYEGARLWRLSRPAQEAGQGQAGTPAEWGATLDTPRHGLMSSLPSLQGSARCGRVGAGRLCPRWASLTAPAPHRCFQPVLTHVQTLWELMLLGEPLLVLAPSPAMASDLVLALIRYAGQHRAGLAGALDRPLPCLLALPRSPPALPPHSCLQPLKFCCDYRPYFTIHDSEFKEFTTRTQAP